MNTNNNNDHVVNDEYSLASESEHMLAIIGMACRFPGANDLDAYWQLLRDGIEARTELSDDTLRQAGVDPAYLANPHYVKSAMCLSDITGFDAAFFDISPREATLTDPQQRLLLECAWSALEHAGYGAEAGRGSVGVYAGMGENLYFQQHLAPRYPASFSAERFQS